MRALSVPICILLSVSGLLAGCLDNIEGTDPDGPQAPPSPAPARGTMTSMETAQTSSGVCPGMTPVGSEKPYCAWRSHWIGGDLDLSELPISLSTFNGDVQVAGGVGRAWNVTAVLFARGSTDSEARLALDNIRFQWSHEERGGHYLRGSASRKNQDSRNHEQAELRLSVPASLLVALQASSASGDVSATGLQGQQVHLSSASGDVRATALTTRWLVMSAASGDLQAERVDAQDLNLQSASGDVSVLGRAGAVQIRSASGDISASLRPSSNSTWGLNAASGDVHLKVPEERGVGYSLNAGTASGSCSIGLKDGNVSGSERSKQFETQGYPSRPLRVRMTLNSASGDVAVSPL